MGHPKGHPVDMLRPYVRPGDCVLDIGAFEGAVTASLAEMVGPSGRVVAFEPQTERFPEDALTQRFGAMVSFRPYALGSRSDTAECARLWLNPDRPAMGSFVAENTCVADETLRSSRLVPRFALDDVVPLDLKPTAMKIDVQGWEPYVVAGARSFLRRYHPVLVLECWPWGLCHAHGSVEQLWAQLVKLAYRVQWADGKTVTWDDACTYSDQIKREFKSDPAHAPNEHVNWLARFVVE